MVLLFFFFYSDFKVSNSNISTVSRMEVKFSRSFVHVHLLLVRQKNSCSVVLEVWLERAGTATARVKT